MSNYDNFLLVFLFHKCASHCYGEPSLKKKSIFRSEKLSICTILHGQQFKGYRCKSSLPLQSKRGISDLQSCCVCRVHRYRVSHETWQLVNSFDCLLTYTVLDIKGCLLQIISFKTIFCSTIFYFEVNFTTIYELNNLCICIKQLNKLWKKTF